MPNVVTLLGAGFSKNWNGLLATEVTAHLMAQLQSDAYLFNLLHRNNFEDALAQLQRAYVHSRLPSDETRLTTFQTVLSDIFDRMNTQFQSRQFEFSRILQTVPLAAASDIRCSEPISWLQEDYPCASVDAP